MMTTRREDVSNGCPECKGSGRVLLLFSWAECRKCEGTGRRDEDDADTGEFPVMSGLGTDTCEQGSGGSDRLEGEDDPSYFDDGLEFDDHEEYDDDWWAGDTRRWEGDDS